MQLEGGQHYSNHPIEEDVLGIMYFNESDAYF